MLRNKNNFRFLLINQNVQNIFNFKKYNFVKKFFSDKNIKSRAPPSTGNKEETIFLFSHDARKYYIINIVPLVGYLLISLTLLTNSDYPDYLRGTMFLFGAACFTALIGISIYSKRHINHISLTKPSNIFLIKTFSKLGFGKDKEYQIPFKGIGELVPISKYIKTKNTGVFILKPNQNVKYFNFFNFFFIRPKGSIEFDQIFKNRIKKH